MDEASPSPETPPPAEPESVSETAETAPPASAPSRVRVGILVAVSLLVFWFGLDAPRPTVLPEDAPANEFSAERAARTVEQIAHSPHPTGHPENERVREFLVEALDGLGAQVSVQEMIVTRDTGPREQNPPKRAAGSARAVRVQNVIGHFPGTALPGTEPSEPDARNAVLLCAHYDSRSGAPGAADDGSGVAIILEVIGNLRERLPFPRDLIVCLTDAEELGLQGARGFVAEHPLAKRAAVVINLEARGNRGASRMFETAPGNWEWIERLDAATGSIASDSLSSAIYRALPRDTDFTVFRKSGIAGYNFAFIRGFEIYHTPLDTPDRLDRGTLQEQGEHVLALATALAEGELPQSGETDAVFFPFARELWRLHPDLMRVLTYLTAAGVLIAIGLSLHRKTVRFGGMVRAGLGGALWLSTVSFFVLVAGRILHSMFHEREAHPTRYEAAAEPLLFGLALAGVALVIRSWQTLRNSGLRRAEMIAVAVLAWGGLGVALEFALPGSSYLGTFPALGGIWILLRQQKGVSGDRSGRGAMGALPWLALWPRTLVGIGVAFGADAALGWVALIGLGIPLLSPLLAAAIPPAVRKPTGWIAIGTFVILGGIIVQVERGRETPRAGSVHYAYDAEEETAVWLSFDRNPGSFERQFLSGATREYVQYEGMRPKGVKAWVASAVSQNLPVPMIEAPLPDWESGNTEGGARTSRAEGAADRDDPDGEEGAGEWRSIFIDVPEGTARIELESADGLRDLEVRDGERWRSIGRKILRFQLVAPTRRVECRVRLEEGERLEFRLTTMRYGTPDVFGWEPEPRGDGQMESIGDRTYVTVSFRE